MSLSFPNFPLFTLVLAARSHRRSPQLLLGKQPPASKLSANPSQQRRPFCRGPLRSNSPLRHRPNTYPHKPTDIRAPIRSPAEPLLVTAPDPMSHIARSLRTPVPFPSPLRTTD